MEIEKLIESWFNLINKRDVNPAGKDLMEKHSITIEVDANQEGMLIKPFSLEDEISKTFNVFNVEIKYEYGSNDNKKVVREVGLYRLIVTNIITERSNLLNVWVVTKE